MRALRVFVVMVCAFGISSYAQTNVREVEWKQFQNNLDVQIATTWQLVNAYHLPKGVDLNTVQSIDEVNVYAALTDRNDGIHVYPIFSFRKDEFLEPDNSDELRRFTAQLITLRNKSRTQKDRLITEEQENVTWKPDEQKLVDRIGDMIINEARAFGALTVYDLTHDPFRGIITQALFKDGKKQIAVKATMKNPWGMKDEIFITSYPLEGSTPDAFQAFLLRLPSTILRFRRPFDELIDPLPAPCL